MNTWPDVEKEYFECSCGCSVLSVYATEWDTTEVGMILYGQFDTSFKERIKHIWSILKYGHPWGSQELLLRGKDAVRLGKLLVKNGEFAIRAEKEAPTSSSL